MNMVGEGAGAVNVLLVEDHRPLADLYALAITLEGWRPTVTGDVHEALAVLQSYRPDVVLTDVMLPGGLSGIDLAGHLHSSHPGTPVVVMSADDSPQVQALAMSSGARHFLTKPFSMVQLISCLRSVRPAARPTTI